MSLSLPDIHNGPCLILSRGHASRTLPPNVHRGRGRGLITVVDQYGARWTYPPANASDSISERDRGSRKIRTAVGANDDLECQLAGADVVSVVVPGTWRAGQTVGGYAARCS